MEVKLPKYEIAGIPLKAFISRDLPIVEEIPPKSEKVIFQFYPYSGTLLFINELIVEFPDGVEIRVEIDGDTLIIVGDKIANEGNEHIYSEEGNKYLVVKDVIRVRAVNYNEEPAKVELYINGVIVTP